MIVVDASVILEVLLRTDIGRRIEDLIFRPDETLHAPHLLDCEVVQALRRYQLHEELSPQRGQQAIEDLIDFPIVRYPHDPLLPRMWQLRHHVTAYDAAYLVLAEVLSSVLLTGDRRLAKVPKVPVQVVVVR